MICGRPGKSKVLASWIAMAIFRVGGDIGNWTKSCSLLPWVQMTLLIVEVWKFAAQKNRETINRDFTLSAWHGWICPFRVGEGSGNSYLQHPKET